MTLNLKISHVAKLILFLLINFFIVTKADPRASIVNLTCGANKTTSQNIIPTFIQQMEVLSNVADRRRGWGITFESGSNPMLYALAQCMNDLSATDCKLCYAEARTKIPQCIPSLSARAHLDGCFLRWDDYKFYQEATDNRFDTSVCNSSDVSTQDNLNSDFTSKVKEVITNVTDTAVREGGFATSGFKKGVLNVYALAQCWHSLNSTGCQECLDKAAREVNKCLPVREGRGLNTGCYLRYSTHKFYNDDELNQSNGGTKFWQKIGIGLGVGIACMFVSIMLFLGWKRGYLSSKKISWKRNTNDQRLVEIFLKNYGSIAPERYSYSDIKKVTSSFKDKIGQGGYGEVYKGKLSDGRLVAVKLLNEDKGSGEDFINEVASISRTSHVNIVSLFGFCFDGSKRALVYEFMENGSLEKFIDDHDTLGTKTHLGWEALYQIALGVARGLEYLHRGCNSLILHFDIKPHNILLDQYFNPKISDFGLAKLYPRDKSITSMLHARGTFGYIAPEMIYRNFGKVSHKSDVYSYGMMVLDMVGKRTENDEGVDNSSEIYFPQKIYESLELDEDLELCEITSQEEKEITKKMILVALWCIQTNPVDRPAMSRVVEMLEGNLELLSIPPKPYLCSPPRSHTISSSRLRNSITLPDSQSSTSMYLMT